MAYDEVLAGRIRHLLAGESGVSEKKMFGGLAFLVDGHMALAAGSDGAMMIRVAPDLAEEMLGEHVRPQEMQGRQLRGWLHLDQEATATDEQLGGFVEPAVAHARSLPPQVILRPPPGAGRTPGAARPSRP